MVVNMLETAHKIGITGYHGSHKDCYLPAKSGKIEFRGDVEQDTVWGSLNQIAELFGRDKSVVSRHIKNIIKTSELNRKSTVAKIATVQKEGKREVTREIEYYNLDMILSVGYRVDSKQATQFRIWATKTLKQHLLKGYTVNKKQIVKNYDKFMQAISNMQALLPRGGQIKTEDVIELIHAFADTWFSLDAYDSEKFPTSGTSKKAVAFTSEELGEALENLKLELIEKKQATELFGRERAKQGIESIVGNIFQSFGGKDVYLSLEEKAGLLRASLTSEALTAITLLVAGSAPRDKDKMIGLVMLLLQKN